MASNRGNFQQPAKVIYLATHGNDTQIGQTVELAISRTELRNDLTSANKSKQVCGLYLGTCFTGNSDTARFLLNNGSSNMDWVAGYTESVDWVDGSAIDMVFFHKLTEEYIKNKSRHRKASANDMAKKAATELIKLIPGSHSKYGFNIYFRDGKKITSMFDGK